MLNITMTMLNKQGATPPPIIDSGDNEKIYMDKTPYVVSLVWRLGGGYIILPKFYGTGFTASGADRWRDLGLHFNMIKFKPGYGNSASAGRVWVDHNSAAICTDYKNAGIKFNFNYGYGLPNVPLSEYLDKNNWNILYGGGYYDGSLANPVTTINQNLVCGKCIDLVNKGYNFPRLTDSELRSNIAFVMKGCVTRSMTLVYHSYIDYVDFNSTRNSTVVGIRYSG